MTDKDLNIDEHNVANNINEDIFSNLETLYREVNVGKNIGAIRRSMGISQEYIASQLGVCQQTVSRIEKESKINLKYFEKIADILGKSTTEILNWDLKAIIENTQNIYDGGKSYNDSSTDYSTQTNSLDVIKLIVSENEKLHLKIIKEKDNIIKEQKIEIRQLKSEIKQLRDKK